MLEDCGFFEREVVPEGCYLHEKGTGEFGRDVGGDSSGEEEGEGKV